MNWSLVIFWKCISLSQTYAIQPHYIKPMSRYFNLWQLNFVQKLVQANYTQQNQWRKDFHVVMSPWGQSTFFASSQSSSLLMMLARSNVTIFFFSRGKGNLVTDVSMINGKFIYIKYISKNDLTWQWFKHQSIFTLLTFAHICIQCVVGCACCAIPRNIAVTALSDITSGCKNKIITMSTMSCHCWLFYHIMKRLSRM